MILSKNIDYIIVDRTAFNNENKDRLTLQIVPPEIYEASYPAWFLNEERFLSLFEGKYILISDFDAMDQANIPSKYKGFIFRKIENV
jgi:putative methyltransferase (TIGR04325 family)